MKKARIKGTDRLIEAKELIRQYGVKPEEKGIETICPACSEPVFLFGVVSLKVSGHFNHYMNQNCILSNRISDQWIRSKEWDLERGKRIRDTLSKGDNLKQLYTFCNNLCGKSGRLGVDKFSEIIKEADRRNIWSYKNIPLWAIPYVLLALKDFEGIKKNKKPFSFRFVLQEKPPKNIKIIWESECYHLLRVFGDSGSSMDFPKGNPYALTKEIWKNQSKDYHWLDQKKFTKLLQGLEEVFDEKEG